MSGGADVIEKIRADLDALEKGGLSGCDAVDGVMGILGGAIELMLRRYDHQRLKSLRDGDDPAFDRFAFRLKTALEAQLNYIMALSDLFMADPDILSEKITASREKLEAILADERMIFRHASAMLEKEEELKSGKSRLEALLARKSELEAAQKRLSEHDADALARQVEYLAEVNGRLETEIGPLRDRREGLQAESEALGDAMRRLTSDIEALRDAYGSQAAEIAGRIPGWIEMLKSRMEDRETKDQAYCRELEREARRLAAVEERLRARLRQMDQMIEAAETNEEIIRAHFEANQLLAGRFAMSLPRMAEEIESTLKEMEDGLWRFDELLKAAQARLEEIAAERCEIAI